MAHSELHPNKPINTWQGWFGAQKRAVVQWLYFLSVALSTVKFIHVKYFGYKQRLSQLFKFFHLLPHVILFSGSNISHSTKASTKEGYKLKDQTA